MITPDFDYTPASFSRRSVAFFIDAAVLFILVLVCRQLFHTLLLAGLYGWWAGFFLCVLYFSFFDSPVIPIQTPGKFITGIRVISCGKSSGFFQGICRTLLFMIFIAVVRNLILADNFYSPFSTAPGTGVFHFFSEFARMLASSFFYYYIVVVGIITNLLVTLFGVHNRLVHDFVSNTAVVLKNNTDRKIVKDIEKSIATVILAVNVAVVIAMAIYLPKFEWYESFRKSIKISCSLAEKFPELDHIAYRHVVSESYDENRALLILYFPYARENIETGVFSGIFSFLASCGEDDRYLDLEIRILKGYDLFLLRHSEGEILRIKNAGYLTLSQADYSKLLEISDREIIR